MIDHTGIGVADIAGVGDRVRRTGVPHADRIQLPSLRRDGACARRTLSEGKLVVDSPCEATANVERAIAVVQRIDLARNAAIATYALLAKTG